MMYVIGCKTKKDLRACKGVSVDGLLMETLVFGHEYRGDGKYCVVGPSPYNRKWYATVTVKDGRVAHVI